MIKLNKVLYVLLLFVIVLIHMIAISLDTTYALQDFRELINEFNGKGVESETEKPPIEEISGTDKPTEPEIDSESKDNSKQIKPDKPKSPAVKPPKTADDADPRPWLIILAISVFILRYILFFRKKTKRKE